MTTQTADALLGWHCLNGYLLLGLLPVTAGYLLIKQRLGRRLRGYDRALLIVLQVLLFLQVYMGILQLHLRQQQDVWHYTFGLLPLVLFAGVYWLFPGERGRWMLALGLMLIAASGLAWLAFLRV
jgi:hypothetical protein